MSSGVELQGIDQLLNNIRRKFGNASARLESKALHAAGNVIAEEMESRVNLSDNQYVSGAHLKEDIRVSRVIRREGRKYVLIGPGRKTGWRAHFPEFGTSKMPARPFAEPAFHAKKKEALQTLAHDFREALRS